MRPDARRSHMPEIRYPTERALGMITPHTTRVPTTSLVTHVRSPLTPRSYSSRLHKHSKLYTVYRSFHSIPKPELYLIHDPYFEFFTFFTSFGSHHSLISEGLSGVTPTAFSQSTPPSPQICDAGGEPPPPQDPRPRHRGSPHRHLGCVALDRPKGAALWFPSSKTNPHAIPSARLLSNSQWVVFFCASTEGGSIPSFVGQESVGHYHRRSITDIASKQISTPKPVELFSRSFFCRHIRQLISS